MPPVERRIAASDQQQNKAEQMMAGASSATAASSFFEEEDADNATLANNLKMEQLRRYACPPPPLYWNVPATTSAPTAAKLSAFNSADGVSPYEEDALQFHPCPQPYDQFYCFNHGHCFTIMDDQQRQWAFPFCRCAPNFHGRRCEYLFDANFYGIGLNMEKGGMASSSSFASSSHSTPTNFLFLLLLMFALLLLFRHKLAK